MDMKFHRFDLPLRHVFTISRGSTALQQTFIVELSQNGISGYGEATVNSYYGATYENMESALISLQPLIKSHNISENLSMFCQSASEKIKGNSFALCALDLAAHDLWSKLNNKHVYQLWGLDASNLPLTDYTIGIDEVPVMIEKMRQFDNWPIYKIKLGTNRDIEIVRALREHSDAVFRVDANCGWSADQCIEYAPVLAELGVEFIEQPLPPDDIAGMKKVYANCALPVIADESCIAESDVDKCAGLFHGVNIKLCKCGGLAPGRRMALRARSLGMKVMCGCMTESSVGITAIAQLLPLLDYVDADGALLLAEDIAEGVVIDRGVINYPETPGVKLTAPH